MFSPKLYHIKHTFDQLLIWNHWLRTLSQHPRRQLHFGIMLVVYGCHLNRNSGKNITQSCIGIQTFWFIPWAKFYWGVFMELCNYSISSTKPGWYYTVKNGAFIHVFHGCCIGIRGTLAKKVNPFYGDCLQLTCFCPRYYLHSWSDIYFTFPSLFSNSGLSK